MRRTRKREEEELASELARLKKLRVKPAAIAHISDEMLDQWIQHIREAFENGDQAVVRRTIRQFVAKIVVKNETGTLYYTFPFEVYMSSFGDLDLKRLELLTSTVRL
jgi:hypothetical protein